ncbi:hypothetical protein [Kosakonia sp. R1.Fl]|uniref:hypothetical protein n=1 Tax=Kosakonia sp. R1.Fl TaxID=2928706 RepID=UPI00201D7FFD|nr:hypothetical protein [Kosakonia sp. R1.Fl]MCL6742281.1 hypothetical protein [Kosakonia sp. R1.Fl]
MLHAILHGKAGRIGLEGKSLRWRDIFKGSEDLLTATIFGRIPHLSDQALRAFMSFLLGDPAENLTEFQQLDLWPKLESLSNRHYVEPDILLHFEDALVIVEVKPSFGGNQYREQWLAQVNSVISAEEFNDYESRLYYVALGNIPTNPLTHPDLPERFVQMTLREWEPLRSYLQSESEFQTCRQDRAIRNEWLQAFELFGMAPSVPEWAPLFAYAQQLNLDNNLFPLQEIITKSDVIDWAPLLNYAGTLNLSSLCFHR